MRTFSSCVLGRIACVLALQLIVVAQQPGTNVNVLPSYPNSANPAQPFYPFPPGPPAIPLTDSLRGDGYLQRQVEPSIASSSYNPDHLLAAFGDYRTVSIPGSSSDTVTSEGWIGISRSYDRGHTWFGSMVPGFPQDTSTTGLKSPLHGLMAGSDANLATTPGGHFYLAGLFFTRGGISNVAVMHYRDIPAVDGGDSIQYQGAVIVDKGSQSDTGNFEDKPSIAADIARGTTSASVCGPVYIAYTIFVGGTAGVFTSKIGFSSSAQGSCGASFSHQQYLNKNFKQNQGTAVAVDPISGKIYVVWRHIYIPGGDGFPDGIVMATSTDGGVSFSAPAFITPSNFAPFDQQSVATTTDSIHPAFRSTAYPTLAVDGSGNLYMAIQEKTGPSVPANYPPGYYSPRIVLRTLKNGQSQWTKGSIVDSGISGSNFKDAQQVMPVMSFAAGQLRLMWYDFRDQNQVSDSVGGAYFISGLDRHIATYIAQSTLSGKDANGNPAFNASVPVTQYLSNSQTQQTPTVGNVPPANGGLPAINRPNLPMYVDGTMPFTGDYITLITANPFVANPGGSTAFRWATKPSDYIALDSYGVWADTRDVVFPTFNSGGVPNLYDLTGWTQYAPPGTGLSCINGGARDQNIYFSEIKPGIVAGSPATSRQLVDGNGKAIERAFPIYVQNPTGTPYSYQFSFASGSGQTVRGSFVQGTEVTGADTTSITVPVVAYSSGTFTLYAYCPGCSTSTGITPFSVTINQQDPLTQATLATTTVFFNSDSTAPFVTNTQVEPLSSGEVHNASVSNPQWANPQWANPQWANPQWANPQWANPQWANIAPSGATTPVNDLVWTVTNAGNNASAYTSILNVATSNLGNNYLYQILVSRQYNFPGFSSCASQPIPQDQIISIIPNVDFSNPQWANPQWANPQWANPQWANATFASVPPPPGGGNTASSNFVMANAATVADDGTTKMPVQTDHVYVVLRIYRTNGSTTPLSTSEQAALVSNVSQVVVAQAANTGSSTVSTSSNKGFVSAVLTSSVSPTVYGQAVVLSAKMTPTSGTGTPGGSVDFKDGTNLLQTVAMSGGVATLSISTLASGTHVITAFYSGDANFNGGMSNTLTQTVNMASSTTTLASTPDPSIYGQTVNFMATVAPVAPGSGSPSGTVTFKDGATSIQTVAVSGGVATLSISTLAPGTHVITAFYSGDVNFGGGSSNVVTQTVNAEPTATTLASTPDPSTYGQTISFVASVTPVPPAAGSPTGTVIFFDGSLPIGSAQVMNGAATLMVATLAPGAHSITAAYQGAANFAASTSSAVPQIVQGLTSTVIGASPSPSAVNQAVTFTATVSPIGGGGTPSGTVTFVFEGKNSYAAALSNGVASTSYTFTGNNIFTVTATYSGDGNFAGSIATPFSQAVESPQFADFSALANCGFGVIPQQPILSYTQGGNFAAPPYNVRVSYVTGAGESGASGVSTIYLQLGTLLVVNSPGAAIGATGWNVYVNSVLQNTAPIAIGTSWTEPATGLVNSGQAPSAAPINPANTPGCLQLNSGTQVNGATGGAGSYGNTVLNSGANALELTQEISAQDSSAWFNVLQPVKNGFTTTFTFQLSDPESGVHSGFFPADGVTFVVHNSASGLGAIGGAGGSLGYGPSNQGSGDGAPVASQGSVDNSVVVEFDVYNNGNANGDPNGNHVAIQSCGAGAQATTSHTVPASGPNSTNSGGFSDCLYQNAINPYFETSYADGNPHSITIQYLPVGASSSAACVSAGTGELDVLLDGQALIVSACMTIENQINLGGVNGDSAYVGFTAATGALADEADILNWNFTPTLPVVIE